MSESRRSEGATLTLLLLLVIAAVLVVVVGGGVFFIRSRQFTRNALVERARADAVAAEYAARNAAENAVQAEWESKEATHTRVSADEERLPEDSLASVLELDAKPAMLQDRGAGEGPAWHPELGLLTSGDGHIMRRAPRDGAMSIHLKDAGSNGLMFDRQGRLIICDSVRRRVSRQERDGQLTVLAENFEGKRFNQPNDLTMDSRGRIYFTDPQYGERGSMEMLDAEGRQVEGVYRIDPDGRVARILTREVDRPNGIVVTADDHHLFVADNNNNTVGGPRKLWRFDLKADGTLDLTSQTLIHDWNRTRGPDGIKLDAAGNVFVAAGSNKQNPPFETQPEPTAGVYVFSPSGKLLEFIPIPRDECTNCAFGGDDLRTLYVTAGGTLWSARVRLPGRPAWPSLKE